MRTALLHLSLIRLVLATAFLAVFPNVSKGQIEAILDTPMPPERMLEGIDEMRARNLNYLPYIIDQFLQASRESKALPIEGYVKTGAGYDLNISGQRALWALEVITGSSSLQGNDRAGIPRQKDPDVVRARARGYRQAVIDVKLRDPIDLAKLRERYAGKINQIASAKEAPGQYKLLRSLFEEWFIVGRPLRDLEYVLGLELAPDKNGEVEFQLISEWNDGGTYTIFVKDGMIVSLL